MLDENHAALQKMVNKKIKRLEKKQMFFYLGNPYDIIEMNIIEDVEIDGTKIYVRNKEKLKKWYQAEVSRIFEERFIHNFNLFEEADLIPSLKIRKMKSRWGVYNKAKHSITLNSNLIEHRIEVLDYVIIHELSHIIHFDHSASFWNLVANYYPNYKKIRKELKE